jgi:isopentenyldiphosphate isomerase
MGNDESVYHVDKDDAERGAVARSVAHRDALYHRAAHILLLTPDDRLILQKRSADKAIAPGRWTSTASGHVKYGSTYHDTAVEELREETKLEGIRLRLLGKLVLVAFSGSGEEVCRGWTSVFAGRFLGEISELRPEAGEVERFQAFPLDDVLRAVFGEVALRDATGRPVLFSTTFAGLVTRYAEKLRQT